MEGGETEKGVISRLESGTERHILCHEEAELTPSRGAELARAERNEEHRFDGGR